MNFMISFNFYVNVFQQAQRALLKQKNIVKLQAAVRGHLVRRHAVGTLRCIQAIVKMQALVRARHARLSKEGPSIEEKLNEKHGKDNPSLELLVMLPNSNLSNFQFIGWLCCFVLYLVASLLLGSSCIIAFRRRQHSCK